MEAEQGARQAIDTILRVWQGKGKPDAPVARRGEAKDAVRANTEPRTRHGAATNETSACLEHSGGQTNSTLPDAFDAFIAEARQRTFSVTCMAFQDAWNVDLDRLRGCCVHVFMPPDRLVPFCACNLTALDGTPLHRPGVASA